MGPQITTHEFTTPYSHKIHYLAAGPSNGPLMILVHGWIAVGSTWTPQLLTFASLGFRVVAPDTRGYGKSSAPSEVEAYRLEEHSKDLMALLKHLGRDRAIWLGHDWGAGLVWGFVAHHPEACAGDLVNKDIHPAAEYPNGQWDYQQYQIEQPDHSAQILESNPEGTIAVFYLPGDAKTFAKPSALGKLREVGGWWRGKDRAPDVPLEHTILADYPDVFKDVVETVKKNGTRGPNAYYRNHEANKIYTAKAANNGILEMPVLFVGGRFDSVCDTSISRLCEPMRETCTNLTEVTIDSGHWIALEEQEQLNAVVARWVIERVPRMWPGYWSTPFASTT